MASINLDIAQRLDITCRKGDTFFLTLNITDAEGVAIDLSSYEFEMEVRDSATDAIVIQNSDVVFTKNSQSTYGRLDILIPATSVNVSGVYIYDLETSLSNNIKTWLYGIFQINDDVTA